MSIKSLLLSAIFTLVPASLLAETLAPLQIINNNPTTQIFGLPFIGQAELLDAGQQEFSLIEDFSNIYIGVKRDDEEIFFDGELRRTNFVYKLGVGDGHEWQLVIPYIRHSGGTMDGFIDEWHGLFNLPDSGRNDSAHDDILYFVNIGDTTLLDFDQTTAGLGDIRLQMSWQLKKQIVPSEVNSALSVSLKLPTGDSDKLTGSGGADLAIWYRHEQAQQLYIYNGGVFYSAGILLMSDSEVIPELHENLAVFGGIGAGIEFESGFHLISQLDINSALFPHSKLNELGDPAVQFTLGGRYKFNQRYSLDFAIAEDLMIDASPDVTLHLEFKARID